MPEKQNNFFQRISRSYHLSVSDKGNFKDVYVASVSKLKLYLVVLFVFLLSAAIVVLVFIYTPVKKLLPGYPSDEFRELMLYNSVMIDSLEQELVMRDNYLEQIRTLIEGRVVEGEIVDIPPVVDVELEPMNDDSIFNTLIGPDKYKFSYYTSSEELKQLIRINFFPPVKGIVVNRFMASPEHLGTDIVADKNSYISSVLDGTVIFAEWSVSTGYVVQIQHSNNLISVYKHNSEVLVKQGQRLKAGDVIAIMGDEGELSTGPHLHFELWQNGVPLDSENYITFN